MKKIKEIFPNSVYISRYKGFLYPRTSGQENYMRNPHNSLSSSKNEREKYRAKKRKTNQEKYIVIESKVYIFRPLRKEYTN